MTADLALSLSALTANITSATGLRVLAHEHGHVPAAAAAAAVHPPGLLRLVRAAAGAVPPPAPATSAPLLARARALSATSLAYVAGVLDAQETYLVERASVVCKWAAVALPAMRAASAAILYVDYAFPAVGSGLGFDTIIITGRGFASAGVGARVDARHAEPREPRAAVALGLAISHALLARHGRCRCARSGGAAVV